ncbi:MAG: hypothetical protein WBG17_08655, partial [Burkholderiaceae bacterium]
ILASGQQQTTLATLGPDTLFAPAAAARIETVLAAVAAAWALGMPADVIRAGLETPQEKPAGFAANHQSTVLH